MRPPLTATQIATQLVAIIPILATAYTCQMTVHHIMRRGTDPTALAWWQSPVGLQALAAVLAPCSAYHTPQTPARLLTGTWSPSLCDAWAVYR